MRRLEDEKDNERIRREQQAEEARWVMGPGSWISYLEKTRETWEDDMTNHKASEVSAGIRHHGNILYYHCYYYYYFNNIISM